MRQRTRWMKGYMQTCVTHSRNPLRLGRELGWAGLAGTVATLAGTVASALVYPILMGLALYSLCTRPPGWEGAGTALFVSLGLAAMLAPAGLALRRRDLRRLRRLLPVLPL
jgi:glycosyltransferase XagB